MTHVSIFLDDIEIFPFIVDLSRIHTDTAMIETLEAETRLYLSWSNSSSCSERCATVAARDAYVVVSAQPHLQTSVGELQYVTPPSQPGAVTIDKYKHDTCPAAASIS